MRIDRRQFLAGAAALAASPGSARAAVAPRLTITSQWSAGNDLHAMEELGKRFVAEGGSWTHDPVPGGTAGMMNKVRAQIMANDPPAASQLKGPEIAAWSKVCPTVNMNDVVAATGFEKLLPAEVIKLHKPFGDWISLPVQIFRMNTLYISQKAIDKVGDFTFPKTWDDYNALASRMAAKGIIPCANGGLAWDHGMKFEMALAGISIPAYRAAIMNLDMDALNGKEVLAAFEQLRRLAKWWNPAAAGQHYSVFLSRFMQGELGMLMMGGMAEGVARFSGFKPSDYVIGPCPQDSGPPAFDLEADAFIVWQKKEEDLKAGQKLLADIVMRPNFGKLFSGITGSTPVRTDTDMSDPIFTDGQRQAAKAFAEAIKNNTVILSLGQNMAQPAPITTAMLDVIAEYVSDGSVDAKTGQKRLVEAVDNAK